MQRQAKLAEAQGYDGQHPLGVFLVAEANMSNLAHRAS
jgi:hypothetical protein